MERSEIPGFKAELFRACRIIFSLCILADATWYFASFEIRSAYFRSLNLPVPLIYLIIVTYAYFGVRLLINYKLEITCLGMIIAYALVAFIVHHPIGDGGIGDYPSYLHMEINCIQVLTYLGLIAGLLEIFGSVDMRERRKVMHGSKSYAIVLGRAIMGIQFIIHTIYFKFVQHSRRSRHIELMGGSPLFHHYIVGLVHVFGSYFAWFGSHAAQRRLGAISLAIITTLVTIAENETLATSTGVYHMKTEARLHQLIVQSGIITSCMLLYSTAGMEAQSYKKSTQE